jgi:hypothetical protein
MEINEFFAFLKCAESFISLPFSTEITGELKYLLVENLHLIENWIRFSRETKIILKFIDTYEIN